MTDKLHKLQQEQVMRQEKYSGWMLFVLFFIIAVLSVVRVFAANRLVETSDSLRRMDNEVTKLETQNQVLAEEIRSKESISYIENKVTQLGFAKSPRYSYLNSTVEVAFLR